MTRLDIRNKIKKKAYKLDYMPCDDVLWPEDDIIDESKDEIWNRNAIEEHNDEIRALEAIFVNDVRAKTILFKEDISYCLSKELLDKLPKNVAVNNTEAIVEFVIKIFEETLVDVSCFDENVYSDFDAYIETLYLNIIDSYENLDKYIVPLIRKIAK